MVVGLAAALGCGAKTGLPSPPPLPVDAGPDGGAPVDPDAGPPPIPCVPVPIDGGPVRATLSIPASLQVVDVMFLLDSTGSMLDEIDAVRRGLRERVVPGVRASIPDARFGVALFGEFPFAPHAPRSVEAYALRSQITEDLPRVEAALDNTPVWANDDDPEAAIEGLYQVATGAGYGTPGARGAIPASPGCPRGGSGGACFRPEALPVVMLITDAPMHNGPPGIPPVAPYRFHLRDPDAAPPSTYEQAVDAARAAGILVLGLGASDRNRPSPRRHLSRLLRDTGSVDVRDEPLYFDIGGGGARIGEDIIRAVERVAAGVPLDVDARVEDLPGDEVDATPLLRGVAARSASPASAVDRIEGDRFVGVVPGTVLTFEVTVDASGLAPSVERRVFPARIVFRANDRTSLGTQRIDLVVPGGEGMGCGDDV